MVFGREDLAADLIGALAGERESMDLYLQLVRSLAWFHYDRAVCAHLRGDDDLSLVSARAAQAIGAAVEKDAPARGLARPKNFRDEPELYIDFLRNIDLLEGDEARRTAMKPEVRKPVAAAVDADATARIKVLIRNLEFVNATQFGQPGGVSLSESPLIGALVNEGEAAVPLLIECLEKDDRLVRSVSFGRDFHTNRTLLTVGHAAYSALAQILKTREFGKVTEHGFSSDKRGEIGREIREYWGRSKDLPDMERAFAVLADDKATEKQWLEAAKKIVTPVRAVEDVPVPEIVRRMRPTGPPAGAAMKSKKSPSVSELLVRRADSVTLLDNNSTLRIHHLEAACQFTMHLVQWEPAAAREPIRQRLKQCREMETHEFYGPYAKSLHEPLARLLTAGMLQGDDELAAAYAAWLAEQSPEQLDSFRGAALFLPLSYLPREPHLAKASETVFADPESRWRPLHEKVRMSTNNLLTSPLVSSPGFQEMLIQELKNTAELGTVSVDGAKRNINVAMKNARQSRSVRNPRDPDLPVGTEPQPLRVCDYYAWNLSRFEGSPLFEPYWPVEKRDPAIKEFPGYLKKWGACFDEYLPPWTSLQRFPGDAVRFHLQKKDGEFLHASKTPATERDVAAGRAIFSLEAAGKERRVIPLAMFPQMARWKTLKQFPLAPVRTKEGVEQERFDNAGYIWQVEEVLADGKWQRFYGFVGAHIIAKVPAEEIELLDQAGDEMSLLR